MRGSQSLLTGKPPGRNDPCHCGSGRKYKQCCAIHPQPGGAPARPAFEPLTQAGRFAGPVHAPSVELNSSPAVAARSAPRASQPAISPAAGRLQRDARRLVEARRPDAAIPLLEQAVRLDPASPTLRVDLAAVLLKCGRAQDALSHLAHALWLDDSVGDTHYHLGLALMQKSDTNGAISAFRAAVERAPRLAGAHYHLAELLQVRGLNDQAIAAYEKAAAAEPDTLRGRQAAAWVLILRRRPEEAITLLRRAHALEPKSSELAQLLANTLFDTGRFEAAEEQLKRTLTFDPLNSFLYYKLTTFRKIRPADQPLLRQMSTLLAHGALRDIERMHLHFGLGKAHDDLNEFEAAMRHFEAANRIRAAMAPPNRELLVNSIDTFIRLFPRGGNRFDPAVGADDPRPVFILGLPRSGTTLIEQILSSHPAVAAGGELGFWGTYGAWAMSPGADPFAPQAIQEMAERYQDVLRAISPDALRVTNKNPFNFHFIGLLRLVFPRAFIIHCRRHPVDNCLSMFMSYFASVDVNFMGDREELVFYYRQYTRGSCSTGAKCCRPSGSWKSTTRRWWPTPRPKHGA
jgi:tetratricopeptide (TPR) repeat protein